MKHKEKRLEYARQVLKNDEKKFNLDGPDGFQKYLDASDLRITLQGIVKEGSLMILGYSHLQKSVVCREKGVLKQDNAAIHNASITKSTFLNKNKTS